MRDLEDKTFLLLLAAVSIAFLWILWPFSGAIVWGTVLAIVFTPLYRALLRSMRQRESLAALLAITLILLIVILPLTFILTLVVREAAGLYGRIEAGEWDLADVFRRAFAALPSWAAEVLDQFGLSDFGAVQQRVTAALARASQLLAATAVSVGQNTLDFIVSVFVALYLLFFLLRDGARLTARIRQAVPLRPDQQHELLERFATVIRATIKGTVLVAAVQGALGGIIFWALGIPSSLLWGAVMAVLSLLPAVGAALVWLPVGLYFLVTGAVWQGIALLAYGIVVISSVDNFLRPLLVGKDTQMPDYLVLMSTLGGLAVFGVNGLIIGPVIAAMFIAAWDLFTAERLAMPDDPPLPPEQR
jgi:predicted PurR-regulated permease PerM